MAHADIHVLGSVEGYTTVARSSGVTADECRELETLSFGDATSAEARARLRTHAVMNGRRLRSGRFAISRMLPGGTDDAGRPTVEVVTLLLPEAAYRSAVRSLGFLADDAGFWSQARSSAQSGIDVPDRPTPAGPVDQAVLRAFDLWFSARRSGAQAVLPESESVTIGRLLAHLDPRDLAACRWGIGLLSLSTPADILTYAPGTSLVGARNVLKAPAVGQWHSAEMDHCAYLVEQTRRLPASDSLAATRTETSVSLERVVDHPARARARSSGVGMLRVASIGSVALATFLLVLVLVVDGRRGGSGRAVVTPSSADGERSTSDSDGSKLDRPDGPKGDGKGWVPSTGADEGYGEAPEPAVPTEGGGHASTGSSSIAPPQPSPPSPSPPPDPPPPPVDSDADGEPDATDPCPDVRNQEIKDITADFDKDGVPDECDNCPRVPNPLEGGRQADKDNDQVGDACDLCPDAVNTWSPPPDRPDAPKIDWIQSDGDGDGVADACDNCPAEPNPNQADVDNDKQGNACDQDFVQPKLESQGPKIEPPPFSRQEEVIAAIENAVAAWKSKERGKGSALECETVGAALETATRAIAFLEREIVRGHQDILRAHQRYWESASPRAERKEATLNGIDDTGDSVERLLVKTMELFNKVLRDGPAVNCVSGDPIGSSRMDEARRGLAGAFCKAFPKEEGFDFKGKPSDTEEFLDKTWRGLTNINAKWNDFVSDIRAKVDPRRRKQQGPLDPPKAP